VRKKLKFPESIFKKPDTVHVLTGLKHKEVTLGIVDKMHDILA
jgi:hypothetical protein